jgi:hypothetical protein
VVCALRDQWLPLPVSEAADLLMKY